MPSHPPDNTLAASAFTGGASTASAPDRGTYDGGSCWDWTKVIVVRFFTGWTLVANIGVGITVVTFLTLTVFLGVEPHRSIPTAVVCGTCSIGGARHCAQ